MDEIDGITGNEDRSGLQAAIEMIQKTSIPIIFIANDRQKSQIRSLQNYCYEIKFERPSFLNIKSRLLEICANEHIRITHAALDHLIHTCNRDLRSIIHTLNFHYKQSSTTLSNFTKSEKALSTSPFDACTKLFTMANLTISEKLNLYFYDSYLIPLLIDENYLRVVPSDVQHSRIELISKAADSLAIGDIFAKLNYKNNNRTFYSYEA